jgi:hypothetical protein
MTMGAERILQQPLVDPERNFLARGQVAGQQVGADQFLCDGTGQAGHFFATERMKRQRIFRVPRCGCQTGMCFFRYFCVLV